MRVGVMMLRVLRGICVVLMILVQLWIVNIDIWYNINKHYTVFYPNGISVSFGLGYGKQRAGVRQTMVQGLTSYATLRHNEVVGSNGDGWFLADADGNVRSFATKTDLSSYCAGTGREFPTYFRRPSRLYDSVFWRLEAMWITTSGVLYVGYFLITKLRKGRRTRPANSI